MKLPCDLSLPHSNLPRNHKLTHLNAFKSLERHKSPVRSLSLSLRVFESSPTITSSHIRANSNPPRYHSLFPAFECIRIIARNRRFPHSSEFESPSRTILPEFERIRISRAISTSRIRANLNLPRDLSLSPEFE